MTLLTVVVSPLQLQRSQPSSYRILYGRNNEESRRLFENAPLLTCAPNGALAGQRRFTTIYSTFLNSGVFHGFKKTFFIAIRFFAGRSGFRATTKPFETKTTGHRPRRQRHGAGHHSSAAAEGPDAEFVEGDRKRRVRKAAHGFRAQLSAGVQHAVHEHRSGGAWRHRIYCRRD